MRLAYYRLLLRYIKMGAWKSKYIAAELGLYKAVLVGEGEVRPIGGGALYEALRLVGDNRYFLFFDFFAVIGYRQTMISPKNIRRIWDVMISELRIAGNGEKLTEDIKNAVYWGKNTWNVIKRYKVMAEHKFLVDNVRKNAAFVNMPGKSLAVIADCAAKKELFVNALTGKRIEQYAPGDVRRIASKPYEDNITDCFYSGGRAYFSTYFSGRVGGEKIALENAELSELRSKKYDLAIISDREEEVDFTSLRRSALKYLNDTPVIFAVDVKGISDCEQWRKKYEVILEKNGFGRALICPVMMKSAFDIKNGAENAAGDISRYYTRYFPEIKIHSVSGENTRALKMSGIAYVERIIKRIMNDEEMNNE